MIDYDALAEFKAVCLKNISFGSKFEVLTMNANDYSFFIEKVVEFIESVERAKGVLLKRCDHSNGKLCSFMKMENGSDIHCDGYRTSCSGYFEDEEINDLTSW